MNTVLKPNSHNLYSTSAVWVLRIVVGGLFIFSGFSKAIDPWGFIFKIEEYLGVWGCSAPRTLILVGGIGLSATEFILGLLLATGCFKKWAPRLLMLIMLFMLPLTSYIWIVNPVSDCGCFGDALKLSNFMTFMKNLIITGALIYLIQYNPLVKKNPYAPAFQWLVGVVGFFYVTAVALYGYNIQPLIDFRAYPEGTDLAGIVAGSDESDQDMEFIYERDGIQKTFRIDELPDSTWRFVERHMLSDSSTDAIAIFEGDADVSEDVIATEGEQILLIIPEPVRADISYSYAVNEIYSSVTAHGGSMIGLIASGEDGISDWIDISMADYPCYSVEDTSLKQLARGTMSLVYLQDGIIRWKRTMSSFDFDTIERIGHGETSVNDAAISNRHILSAFTLSAIGGLLVIYLIQIGITPLKAHFSKKKQKKDVTLQN